MSHELLSLMTSKLIDGDIEGVRAAAARCLEAGLPPLAIIDGGLMPGMREVGERYASGEFYLPNLIVAAAGMKKAMALLDPALKARHEARETSAGVVIGTVKGDIHEIGKSIVATLLTAHGYAVHDLGVDVPAQRFVETVQQTGARLVGLSALLTTTMPAQRRVVEAFEQAGLRDQVKIMIGGAPVSDRWCAEIGADGYADSAVTAVALAGQLVGRG